MKIVLAEKVSPSTLAVFGREPSWQIVTADQIKHGLEAELADADALIVRSAVQVTAQLLESAPRLRVIGRAGVGVDNIDTDAATHRGIVVMNTPGANAVAVAELTLGLMITMARSIPRANRTMHAGQWEKKYLQGTELRGKTLGIVGLGRVGLEVARRARAFDMDILAFDPFVAPVIARENGVTLVPIDQIFSESDYLTLHVGLTPQTEGFINKHAIAIMKPGIRILNCARGELINDAALLEGLQSDKIGGAALDVFTAEPLKDSLFYNVDNVILTPHLGGSTDEAQEAIGIQLAQQVSAYLNSGVVQNAVNSPSLTREEYIEVAPFVDLAERLGIFLAHATPGNLENVEIAYAGRLAASKTDLIRNALLAGVLRDTEQVNHINAASIAAERGLRIQEDRKEFVTGGAGSVLKLVLHSAEGDTRASATVLHGNSPRLLALDGIDIEAPLTGTLLVIRNHDVPGVVGRIGTVLGEHGINIANFALGRNTGTTQNSGSARNSGSAQNTGSARNSPSRESSSASQRLSSTVPQGQALAVLQIDARSPAAALAAAASLRKVEAIASVRLVDLNRPEPQLQA